MVEQFIHQVGVAQMIERIGWGGSLFDAVFLIGGIDIFAGFQQVLDGLVFLVGVVQETDPDLIVQIVIAGILFKKFQIEGEGICIFFKKEPGFCIEEKGTGGIPLCQKEGMKRKEHQNGQREDSSHET